MLLAPLPPIDSLSETLDGLCICIWTLDDLCICIWTLDGLCICIWISVMSICLRFQITESNVLIDTGSEDDKARKQNIEVLGEATKEEYYF